MYFGQYIVQIIERPGMATRRIYLFKRSAHMCEFITHRGDIQTVQDSEAIKDDEVYFADMTDPQLEAFAEALANMGVKTNKDSIAEGKLAATERHLDDMRAIAYKQLGIKGKP